MVSSYRLLYAAQMKSRLKTRFLIILKKMPSDRINMPTPFRSLTVLIPILLSLTLSVGCQSSRIDNPKPTVLFAGLSFSLPVQPKEIAMPNGRGDFLVFKYSNRLGKDYLAFSQEAVIDKSCSSCVIWSGIVINTA